MSTSVSQHKSTTAGAGRRRQFLCLSVCLSGWCHRVVQTRVGDRLPWCRECGVEPRPGPDLSRPVSTSALLAAPYRRRRPGSGSIFTGARPAGERDQSSVDSPATC